MKNEDYYDYKQSRTLSSFKHALIVIGIAFISFISFEIGTKVSQNNETDYYSNLLNMDDELVQTIEVGQIWSYNPYKNDPFKPDVQIHKKVIGVKGNYVLFIESYNDTILDNDTTSEDKSYFLTGSELLNNKVNNEFNLKYMTVDKNTYEYKFKTDFVSFDEKK